MNRALKCIEPDTLTNTVQIRRTPFSERFQMVFKGSLSLSISILFGDKFRRPWVEDFRPCWCVTHRGDGWKGGCTSNCRPQPSLWPDAVRGGWRDQRRSLHRARHTPNPIRSLRVPGAKGLCYQYHEAGVQNGQGLDRLDRLEFDFLDNHGTIPRNMASMCKYKKCWMKMMRNCMKLLDFYGFFG